MTRFALFTLIFCFISGCDFSDRPQQTVQHADGGVNAAALSADGHYAVVASTNHEAGLWDVDQGKLLFSWQHKKQQQPDIIAVSISPEGNYAVTAEKRNFVLWNTSTGKGEQFWSTKHDILAIDLGSNGRKVLIGMKNNTAELVDIQNGQTLATMQHDENINSVALSRDGRYALTGSDDKTAKLWDLIEEKKLYSWPHDKKVMTVALSPNNRYALTSASQDTQKIWDINSGRLVHSLSQAPLTITSARFSETEHRLALGVLPRNLQLWDIEQGKEIQQWRLARSNVWKPTATVIFAVAFTDNAEELVTEDSRGIGARWQIKSP